MVGVVFDGDTREGAGFFIVERFVDGVFCVARCGGKCQVDGSCPCGLDGDIRACCGFVAILGGRDRLARAREHVHTNVPAGSIAHCAFEFLRPPLEMATVAPAKPARELLIVPVTVPVVAVVAPSFSGVVVVSPSERVKRLGRRRCIRVRKGGSRCKCRSQLRWRIGPGRRFELRPRSVVPLWN